MCCGKHAPPNSVEPPTACGRKFGMGICEQWMLHSALPYPAGQLIPTHCALLTAPFWLCYCAPQASVVAALRSEIAALDAQLHGRPVPETLPMPANAQRPSRGPGSFSPGLAGPGSFGGQVGSRAPGGPPPSPSVRSRTEQLADKAFEMVSTGCRGAGMASSFPPCRV
jgi:hypothetical protein